MNWLVCGITLSSIFQDCSFASFSFNDTILFNNLLPMQPQEKRNYQSFPNCDDETTCEWSWFMFEASYLPLVGMPHWHPLGLMGSELYVKVLLCQLYLISLK